MNWFGQDLKDMLHRAFDGGVNLMHAGSFGPVHQVKTCKLSNRCPGAPDPPVQELSIQSTHFLFELGWGA
jgi:hypothetical protein